MWVREMGVQRPSPPSLLFPSPHLSGSLQGQLWQLQKGPQALPGCNGTRLPPGLGLPQLFKALGVSRGGAESGVTRVPVASSRVNELALPQGRLKVKI